MAGDTGEQSQNPNPETMKILYDFLCDAPERQIDNGESLDSKMLQVFSAASVVIGLAGFSSGSGISPNEGAITVLLFLGLLAYGATAYVTFSSLRPVPWRRSLNADGWWQLLWNRSQDEARHSILTDLARSYAANKPLLDAKAASLHLALVTTSAEVILVGVALISARAG